MQSRTASVVFTVFACALSLGCADLADPVALPGSAPGLHSAALATTVAPRAADAAPGRTSRYVVLDGPSALTSVRDQGHGQPFGPSAGGLADLDKRKRVQARSVALRAQHRALRPLIEATGAVIVADMVLVANAFQIVVDPAQLATIAKLPGVARLETPTILTPSLAQAVPLVGMPALWQSASGLHGEGMRIGIIDTGIDYHHATFGGSGDPAAYEADDHTLIEAGTFPTTKVIGGRDLAGDDYDPLGLTGSITPTPDADPIDCAGHGSHVAGIASGAGVTTEGAAYSGPLDVTLVPDDFAVYPGAAPMASLFAIKVFGCEGSTDLVLAALELAADPGEDGDVGDRLDVVNLSLGGSFAWARPVEREAMANLSEAGALVVAAAGNTFQPSFALGFPASEPSALAVGISLKASEVIPAIGLQVDAPTAVAGLYPVGAADVGPSIDELGIYRGEVVLGDPILGCDAFVNATALADKIVLVRRGTCPYATKTQNAAAAGAVAVLVVDNALSDFPNASAGSYVLPIFHLRLIDGDALIAAAPLDVSMGPRLTADITWGPDVLAGIGSRGPTADQLLLKPDLAAPGWQIVSASAGTGIEGIALSGSSMSSPLVAGGAAILRQGRPELGPLDVKALLTSSARPMRGPLGNLFPATGVGAGRIAVDAALAATITARSEGDTGQAGVSFGVVVTSSLRTESRTVVVTSTESEMANLDVTLEAASSWPGLLVTVSPESIEVPPNGSATFELTLTVDPELLPRAPAYGQYMDTVTATPDDVESGRRDTPAIVFTATSGRVVLTPRAGSGEPVAVVAYYGAGRAAAERVVAGASGCVGAVGESATGGSASLTFSGAAAHHDNATSVLELGTITSMFSAPGGPGGPDAFADIVATGALSDPDSERVFFAVATAGDWVTPAQEFLSVVGFEIDTDEDRIADFLVVAESFLQPDPEVPYADLQSAPFARVVDLASGESSRVVEPLNSVDPAYPGGQFFGRETHETQIYFNRVLVMPVSFDNLGLSASDARLAYRGVSIVSRLPFVVDLPADPPMDTTDWAELDAAAPTLSLPDCVAGTPLCADEPDSIALDLHADAVDAALPKLLVLHHANGEAPHHEVIDLADLATAGAFTSDLALTAAPGRAIDEGAEAASEFTVTASDARDDVRLTFTATGGSISALTTSVGTCTADTCELGALARDGSATITVTGLASGAGTLTMTGSVTSTPACESDPANDRATATFTVSAVGPEVGPEPSPEAAEPSPEVAEPSPEIAAEAAPSKGSDSGCGASTGSGSAGLGLALALVLAWRYQRRRVYTETLR